MTLTHKLQIELVLSYRQLYQELRGLLRTCAQENQMSDLQALILKTLQTNPNVGLHDLANQVMCSESQASQVIEQLVCLELVRRERSTEDRRRITLQVTEVGLQRLYQMFGHNSELMERLAGVFSLPEKDLEYLISLNQRIIENLQAKGVK